MNKNIEKKGGNNFELAVSLVKILTIITILACLSILCFTAKASGPTTIGVIGGGGVPVINSAGTVSATQTNCNFGTTTNGIWPNAIPPGVTVTNITPIPNEQNFKDLALQWTAQHGPTYCGSATNSYPVITMARNLSGGNPTNAIGTGLNLEFFTWTPSLVTNTSLFNTSCTNLSSANSLKGGIPNYFIYSISSDGTNANTGGAAYSATAYLTNYAFWSNPL